MPDLDASDETAPGAQEGPAAPDEPAGTPTDGFEALYRENYRPLVQLAYLLTQSTAAADDLVQDVFARVLPRWQKLDDPRPYLRRSVVNAARSWHRRRRLERARPAVTEPSTSLDADELFDILAELPARQRAAVVLRFYEDLSDAEVAAALRCRPGTVASLVHRALAHMRLEMGTTVPVRPQSSHDEGAAP